MPQVTAIKPTKRDPSRATIRVGSKVVATLSYQRIADLGIDVGAEWTQDLSQRADQTAEFEQALRRAMNRLNRRAMTCRQLSRKLTELGHEKTTADAVVEHLTGVGLLDDEAVGRAVIRDQLARKPAGAAFLRGKLFQKGLGGDVIDRLIAEALGERDQSADALRLIESRRSSLQRLDPDVRKRRLWAMLARRGFNGDTIREAMRAAQVDGGAVADGTD